MSLGFSAVFSLSLVSHSAAFGSLLQVDAVTKSYPKYLRPTGP